LVFCRYPEKEVTAVSFLKFTLLIGTKFIINIIFTKKPRSGEGEGRIRRGEENQGKVQY
jgi:hypothetical protein